MRVTRLLSTTAAIVLIGSGIAAAQGMKKDETPARAPAAQQNTPAEKVAPTMAQHPAKPKETTGQGGAMSPKAEQHQGAATPRATDKDTKADKKTGEKAEMKNGGKSNESTAAEKLGTKTRENAEMKNGKANESTAAGKQGDKSRENAEMKNGASGENKSAAGKTEQHSTTGQGAAGAARLSSEQRTKITGIIREHKVAPEHLNVSIAVGTRIPEHVHLYPLPVQVVEVYPEWRGYDYILVGDQILVIDPRSHEIVAILEA